MADSAVPSGSGLPTLNLNPDEKRLYGQLFKAADPDDFEVVSGDVAVKFFERTKLPPDVLGQIWQIADTENRGLLTPAGFGVVLRLIGHAQAGRTPSLELAAQPAPLPRFDGFPTGPTAPTPLATQNSGTPASPTTGGPIQVPRLLPEKVNDYAALFDKSGAENGLLNGGTAKQIFEKARLPNEVLGRIWNLADTQGRGALDTTEFIIAMHMLASYKSGAMRGVPNTLPPGLYDAAARRGAVRTSTGSRPGSTAPLSALPAQFTGQGRPQSPASRPFGAPVSAQPTGDGWMITPPQKAQFDQIFVGVDKANRGFVTGDQAVEFFSNSRLPEDTLASIWDLADINGEGKLSKDEFAVAMFLIRQQRGSKDGRGTLPTTLPPALVPPSMRHQNIQPTAPTAPQFDNAPNITQPKSAADDLFGLDAFSTPSSPPPQVSQSTGGSAAALQTPQSPARGPPPAASSQFRPFVPSSSFGQSIIPQSTGTPSQTRSPPPASDDLLGDADPEVSNKLTQETTELANLSNQVGNLSKQMQEVHGSRATTGQQLSQSGQQKREFESRLSQLRTMYEKEVKDVKALEEQLTASRNETRKIQQDLAMIDGSYQDLKTQHQQLSTQVEAEQRESATLKEKLRQINNEVNALKPAVEKLKSDARQQKGLNAINRKQFATVEGERDRLQGEHETARKELEEARSVPQSSVTSPAPVTSPSVASPAASITSQNNPFFRRQMSGASESGFTSPAASRAIDPRNTFDSVFGPSAAAVSAPPPPSTSFRSESPALTTPAAPAAASPSGSPPSSTFNGSPRVVDPPAPPASRQITSSALPFPHHLDRADSVSSSVRVAPPASRFGAGDTPRVGTPLGSAAGTHSQAGSSPVEVERPDMDGSGSSFFNPPTLNAPVASEAPGGGESNRSSEVPGVPGAFPAFTPRSGTPVPAAEPLEKQAENHGADFDQEFGGTANAPSTSGKAEDFDSAFADMRTKEAGTNGTAAPASEFPPIQEFGDGEEDESDDSEEASRGFDDNFTGASPPRPTKVAESTPPAPTSADKEVTGAPTNLQLPIVSNLTGRPEFRTTASAISTLPAIDAQTSPPGYNEAVTKSSDDHFPAEYNGLLPSRDDPTSPSEVLNSISTATGGPVERSGSLSYGPGMSPPPASRIASPPARGYSNDDFESAFANLDTSKPAADSDDDDDDVDDMDTSFNGRHHTGFDPTFDSPAAPKAAAPAPTSNTFDEFDNFGTNISSSQKSSGAPSGDVTSPSHDWDAIFAGLDGPAPSTAAPTSAFPETSTSANEAATSAAPAASSQPPAARGAEDRPSLGRALTQGTEHDDPILKRLTGMGFGRDDSLRALEKYDYNLDKAADYLTSQS